MFALKLRVGERVRVGDTEIEMTNLRRGHAILSFQGPRDTPIQLIAGDKSADPFVAIVRGPGSQRIVFDAHPQIPSKPDCVLGFDTRPNYVNWPMARKIERAMGEVWIGAHGRDLVLALDLAPMLAFHIGTTTPMTINGTARGYRDATRYADIHEELPSLLRIPHEPSAWSACGEWAALWLNFGRPAHAPISLAWDELRTQTPQRPASTSLWGLMCADLKDGDAAATHPAFWPLFVEQFSAITGHFDPHFGGVMQRLFLFLPDDTPPGLAWLLGRRWARKAAAYEHASLTLVTPDGANHWRPAATYSR